MTPRRSRGRRLVLVAVAAVGLVLGACSEVDNNGQNSLKPKGPQAQKIYDLFVPILIIAIVVGIAIIVATVYLALKFRLQEGQQRESEAGARQHPPRDRVDGPPRVAARDHRGADRRHHLRPRRRTRVRRRSRSTSSASSGGGSSSTPTPRSSPPTSSIIPTGRDVFVKLDACEGSGTSKTCNVIHSFWVPELSGKKDVVPGQTNTLTLNADKPGTYLGQCAEYCGLSHANMRFRVIAKSPSDFQTWLSEQQQGPVNALTVTSPMIPTSRSRPGPRRSCSSTRRTSGASTATSSTTRRRRRTAPTSRTWPVAPPSPAAPTRSTRDNLINWVQDAPSMIPMSSQDCRLPPGQGICVGMPSFIHDTPSRHRATSR